MQLIKTFGLFFSLSLFAMTSHGMSDLPDFDEIDTFNDSWAGQALDLQRDLGLRSPLSKNNIIGTHNSYNSKAYQDIDSYIDPQQTLTIYDQLRLGARFIELDAHWTYEMDGFSWGNNLLLCHSGIGASIGDVHVGCGFTDRKLVDGLQEIRRWLDENPGEMIVLYIEDHTDNQHQALYNALTSKLGNKFYASGSCKDIPASLTPNDVLRADKQIVLWKDSGCSGYAPLAQVAFTGLGQVSRTWEDRTNVGSIGAFFTGGSVSRLEAEDIRQAQKNGINIVNLDNISPTDGRMAAAVWSWDVNEPNNYNGDQDCAKQWGNGRWDDTQCHQSHFFACESMQDGHWRLSSYTGPWLGGFEACQTLGSEYMFSVPTNSQANEALKNAKGGVSDVWLNHHDINREGTWETL